MQLRNVAAIAVLAVTIAGCGSSGATDTFRSAAATSRLGAASPAPGTTSSADVASGSAGTGTALTGQTDTDWGRIWDSVPADFPRFDGSTPSEEAARGPASATLAVEGNVAADVATWMAGQLQRRGYAVDGASTALEDGSFVLDANRDPDCRVGMTVAPTGGTTTITLLYGAGCPKP